MIPKSNLHTHTTYCDGDNTVEEMIKAAISLGGDTLGFSGHSHLPETDWTMSLEGQQRYIEEIELLRDKYKEKITVLLGIEQDCFSERIVQRERFDYVIGSVHAVVKQGIRLDVDSSYKQHLSKGIEQLYGGKAMLLVKDYYALVADVFEKTACDIVGHFDLITKSNEKEGFIDTNSTEYKKYALEALDALIEKDVIFEINTGAISRGWRTQPYPENFILRRLAEKKANIMINSDSHNKETVFFFFKQAEEYAKACGVKELCVYEKGILKKKGI